MFFNFFISLISNIPLQQDISAVQFSPLTLKGYKLVKPLYLKLGIKVTSHTCRSVCSFPVTTICRYSIIID